MRILLLKAGFLDKIRPNVSVVYELAVQAGNREGLLLAGNARFVIANISNHCTIKKRPRVCENTVSRRRCKKSGFTRSP